MAKAKSPRRTSGEPLRYAFPFFTTTPPSQRAAFGPTHATRITNLINEPVGPIPAAKGKSVMHLTDISGKLGRDEIQAAGEIRFHAAGDTGKAAGATDDQEDVATAMIGLPGGRQRRTESGVFSPLG